MIEEITKLIQPILDQHDVYLDDIEYVQEKNEWYLRIFIEKNLIDLGETYLQRFMFQ